MKQTSENRSPLETLLGPFLSAPRARQAVAAQAALACLAGDSAPAPDQILLGPAGAAKVLSCSKMQIWRLVRAGTLKAVILPGTKFRKYRRADLERLAAGGGAV